MRFARSQSHLELEGKLSVALEHQRSLVEEYETSQEELIASNEELQSANEELQSTNEELQSSNEELETAKEELQSANEELIMVNDEAQAHNIEMVRLNDDLTNLLASVDIAIVMVGADGNIRRFTPKAGKDLKLIPSDVGRPIGDIKPNIQVADLNQIVSEVIESMTAKEIETQDMNGYWYRLQVRPYKTAGNRIEGAVVALIDINAVKANADLLMKAAEDLKRSGDDAAYLIGAQPLPLLVIDSDKRVLLANEIFYETFKASRSQTEGRKIFELGSGEWNIPKLLELLRLTLEQGSKFQSFEVDHDFPEIGHRTMLISCRRAELNGSGKTVALFSIEDITERQKTIRAVMDSEEKYRTLVDTVRDYAIFMLSPDGEILSWNQGGENLTGYKEEEIVGKTNALFYSSEDVDRGLMQKELQQAKEKGRYEVENWRVRKDGSRYFANIITSAFHDSTGQLKGYIKIIRDISERKEVEKKRAELLIKEKKANLAKDEFLATLSHELRTPISIILSWAQMLQGGRLDAEKEKKAFEAIERSAKTQAQLIDDLLDISRIQAGKLSLRIQKVDLKKIISAVIDSTRNLAASKSIEIETTIDSSIKDIFADPTRLQQILWNLIVNAIKFSHKGGKIWILLDLVNAPTGRHIQIEVKDNGQGIKSEFLSNIFERFMQVDSTSTRAYGGLGLGLGLAIVRKLVEMHEGKVEAESAGENMGASFRVLIPEKVNVILAAKEAEIGAETEAEVTLEGLRVLLVDDEPTAREAFGLVLQKFGAQVKAVGSASEALGAIEEFMPDILVSDIAMPTEDGYGLIKKIRALNSRFAQIPALAFTAYAGRENVQRALSAGFQSHVAKPADGRKLALAISRLAGPR
ncbi:MAG: PAS domain S-box protein [Bdellovibrionales bacterium]|nr:PAS domain S-box protein [Bdellovibrionales bacterium]